jgi:deoxycytidine triphosphate deaminase
MSEHAGEQITSTASDVPSSAARYGHLSDIEIRARLEELQVRTDNPNFPFDAVKQIQPCLIDLRLSDLIWKPKRFRRLNLSEGGRARSRVANAFTRKRISFPKGYVLRPGEFLLGRTYEAFTVPNNLTARLVGRSSLGRLGLSVVAPSSFINPGWRGHMPLMLVNHSPFRIRVHPYLGIVQLCLMTLTSQPNRPYGTQALGSKYIDDDGGPSKFWLDYSIRVLRQNLNLKITDEQTERLLEEYSKELDEPTRGRFAKLVKRREIIHDFEGFAEVFVSAETKRGARSLILTILVTVPIGILVSWLPTLVAGGIVACAAAGMLALAVIGISIWISGSIGPRLPPPFHQTSCVRSRIR